MPATICVVMRIGVEVGVNDGFIAYNMRMDKEIRARVVTYKNRHVKQGASFLYVFHPQHRRKYTNFYSIMAFYCLFLNINNF